MTDRKGQTLGDVLARIREGAKQMRGKPYVPEAAPVTATPRPTTNAAPPPSHHHPDEEGEP